MKRRFLMTSFKNRKSSQKGLVKLFRYFFPFLKYKQINLESSKTLCLFFCFFFPLYDVKELLQDNKGFVQIYFSLEKIYKYI